MKLMLVMLVLLPLASSFIDIVFRREGNRRKESKAHSLSARLDKEDAMRSFVEHEGESEVIDNEKLSETEDGSKTNAILK